MVELDKKNIENKLFASEFTFEDSSIYRELMALYPWCSSFTVVYLKSLSNTNDMRFPNELEEHAMNLNSREVIYELIHGLESKDLILEDSEELEYNNEGQADNNEDQGVFENHNNAGSNNDELEKMIVSKILSDNLINEIDSEVKDQYETEKKETDNKINTPTAEVNDSKTDFDESPKSFSSWLKMGENGTSKTSDKDYLTFEKPKKDFFSAHSSAKESLGVKNLPVSETLAKVFESQGNYSMAISTYEQLILIFPEKKIFFADQIKKIKIKII